MTRVGLYVVLQTAVAAFISFFPNFTIAYFQYGAGTNATTGIWSFDPTPFGGDLLVTIAVQTLLTYLISGFLISKDLADQPNWMTKVFGIALEPHLITNEKTAKYFNYLRTYQVTDLEDGFKGFGKGLLRIGLNIILWELLIGGPISGIMAPFAVMRYRFSGWLCAFGKGVYGALLSVVQVPVIAYLSLSTTAELRYTRE